MGTIRQFHSIRRSVLLSLLITALSAFGARSAQAMSGCEDYYAIREDCTAFDELSYCLTLAWDRLQQCEDDYIWAVELYFCPPMFQFNVLGCGLSAPFATFL